jgi:hypothetical protein
MATRVSKSQLGGSLHQNKRERTYYRQRSHTSSGGGGEAKLVRVRSGPPAAIVHQPHIYIQLTNYMQLSPSREAAISAAIQKLPDILWNP